VSGPLGVGDHLARFLSTQSSFPLPLGTRFEPGRVRGYYVDMRVKAPHPSWPSGWPWAPGSRGWDVLGQAALGSYERHLAGEGEQWLEATRSVAEYLMSHQHVGGAFDGGLVHHYELGHTFPLRPPFLSSNSQGQAASLLVRLYLETGEERYADHARRALRPLGVPSARGGVMGILAGRAFPEEYPTSPGSFVLNGGIFAMWGQHDVGVGLDDGEAKAAFEESVETLAANVHRWDTGSWSRYDLFPHPVVNVASAAYHALHVNQLRAMQVLAPRPEIATTLGAFERYAASRAARAAAFGRKLAFRLVVPRSPRLARVWPGRVRRNGAPGAAAHGAGSADGPGEAGET